MILLTPGPCMTSDRVRAAAALPDLNHRDPAYLELLRGTRADLLRVYPALQEGWHPYLIGGSGTAAVEAMLTSCIDTGPVLVIENGHYSERLREILEIHKIPYEAFQIGWTENWTPEKLDQLRAVAKAGAFEAMVATHNETTLGRLNPISTFADICKETGTRLLVDAMSSFGADPIDFTGVAAVAASANKCLHGLPGVAFVLVRESLTEKLNQITRRSYYLSLPLYSGETPPLTPPVAMMRAFREALAENPGGQAVRYHEYVAKLDLLYHGLGELGFEFAVPREDCSCTMLSATLPVGWTYDRFFQTSYDAGYVVYACKGDLRERFFQVSVMGEVTQTDILGWLEVVRGL